MANVDWNLQAQIACLWEATARKPGNVHPQAAFRDLEYSDFLLSAVSTSWNGTTIGERILNAVRTKKRLVRSNTNLGIILLFAPLIHAAETGQPLDRILANTTVEDTEQTYEAIRLAAPAGLGKVDHQDVAERPTLPLTEAMRLAADRDAIAWQYASNFEEIRGPGLEALCRGASRLGAIEAGILACQLFWLARVPDSLIARKAGREVAESIQQQAEEVVAAGGVGTPEGRRLLRSLDQHLRSQGNTLNPGTSADLVAACLFVALRETRLTVDQRFRWMLLDGS